ncbi:hypothetical protein [Jannaschia sp. CCS1]|uniref:hypothetical protein n=1 Tax=Jannaschia sp. (strain CCS1) TaxID=290400 RepID=UPI0002DCC301|nr:hypothetical protein [Jannaschia sp. CCS1]
MPKDILCKIHGAARPVYVCDHLFISLTTRVPTGLTWFEEDDGDLQAFCDACWSAPIEEFEARTANGPRLICLHCLHDIAAINDTWLEVGLET